MSTYTATPDGFVGSTVYRATVPAFEAVHPCPFSWCHAHGDSDQDGRPGVWPGFDADGWEWVDAGRQAQREHTHRAPSGRIALHVFEVYTPNDHAHAVTAPYLSGDLSVVFGADDMSSLAREIDALAALAETALNLP